jgi:2-phosphosulfolactate phosphatase
LKLDIAVIPEELPNKKLEGKTVVIIDVLRATTTIATALHNGCALIIPVLEVEEAFKKAKELEPSLLVGGERKGKKVEGFDLGNSPREYNPESVRGKTIILTTTNGTRVLRMVSSAQTIFTCAFVNITAVAQVLTAKAQDETHLHENVLIACAGIEGNFSLEDFVCAGMLVHKLNELTFQSVEKSEAATAAEILYGSYQSNLLGLFQRVRGGLNIIDIGLEDDLRFCAQVDLYDVAPRFENGQITELKTK